MEVELEEEKPPVVMIPNVSDVSERIRKAGEKFDLKVVFESGLTLCSLFTRMKDPSPWRTRQEWCIRSPASVVRFTYGRHKDGWNTG